MAPKRKPGTSKPVPTARELEEQKIPVLSRGRCKHEHHRVINASDAEELQWITDELGPYTLDEVRKGLANPPLTKQQLNVWTNCRQCGRHLQKKKHKSAYRFKGKRTETAAYITKNVPLDQTLKSLRLQSEAKMAPDQKTVAYTLERSYPLNTKGIGKIVFTIIFKPSSDADVKKTSSIVKELRFQYNSDSPAIMCSFHYDEEALPFVSALKGGEPFAGVYLLYSKDEDELALARFMLGTARPAICKEDRQLLEKELECKADALTKDEEQLFHAALLDRFRTKPMLFNPANRYHPTMDTVLPPKAGTAPSFFAGIGARVHKWTTRLDKNGDPLPETEDGPMLANAKE